MQISEIEITAEEALSLFLTPNLYPIKMGAPVPKVKKTYKKRQAKEVAQFSVKPAKGKRRGKRRLEDAKIYEVLDFIENNATIAEIKATAMVSVGTYYRIKSGALKPSSKRPTTTPTPIKIGEREIDQKPAMLTSYQWSEAKDAFNDGLTAGAVAMSLEVDTEEVRRAVKCDNYTEYTAKY